MTFFLACAIGAVTMRPNARTATAPNPSLRPIMFPPLGCEGAPSEARSNPFHEAPSAGFVLPDKPVGAGRVALDDELAVALQRLAVDRDLAALAEVADHVPVDRGLVLAAGLRI